MPTQFVQVPDTPLLSDSRPLWRYMRLSTFFALLDEYVFLPRVDSFHASDPMEDAVACEAPSIVGEWHNLGHVPKLESWLRTKAEPWEIPLLNANPHIRSETWVRIWAREMARRRAVWCWHASDHESAAMWSIYAGAGVAVKTTAGTLKAALPECYDFQIARIKYISRHTASPNALNPEGAAAKVLLQRPFLLKSQEFSHEQEVRVFTRCSPHQPGLMLFNLKSKELIQEVCLAPTIHHAESESAVSLIKKQGLSVPVHRSEILGIKRQHDRTTYDLDRSIYDCNPIACLEDDQNLPEAFLGL